MVLPRRFDTIVPIKTVFYSIKLSLFTILKNNGKMLDKPKEKCYNMQAVRKKAAYRTTAEDNGK